MTFPDVLEQHKTGILNKWLDLVFDTYPPETAKLLKDENDRFANPVAYTLRTGLEKILQYLVNGSCMQDALDSLEQIIKIRAVQDFSPAQAISFMWLLKKAVLSEVKDRIVNDGLQAEWLEFESRVDDLTGKACDVYVACKEKIYQVRIKELKEEGNTLARMVTRQGL